MEFKRYHNPSKNSFAPNISILFNKGKYIEFSVPSPPKVCERAETTVWPEGSTV